MKTIQTDVLIIGSGASALYTASKLKNLGIEKILVVSGTKLNENSSYYAQGGIAAALLEDDSPYIHFKDTLRAGHNLCSSWNTEILVTEGPKRVIDLFKLKVPFEGVTQEGAHSKRRIWYVKDETGKAIWESLFNCAKSLNVEFLENTFFIDFIFDKKNNFLFGAYFLENGETFIKVISKYIVLASGGYASLYKYSSNPPLNNGYVNISAFELGTPFLDLEFIQFHPTGFYNEKENKVEFLISESVRGEGAYLVDENRKRFVNELAPRDVVSRAIFKKYKEGHKVFLDFSPLQKKGIDIEKRFPFICKKLKNFNLDPKKDLIPVSPLAHYTMGGLLTNSFGETKIKNLFVCGEAACTGVHGANRLASNSLLECLVFANRVAYKLYFKENYLLKNLNFQNLNIKENKKLLESFCIEDIKDIKNYLWNFVGIKRNEKDLKEAYKYFENQEKVYKNIYKKRLFKLAKLITKAALYRKESRGAHYRVDYPKAKKEYEKHTLINENEKITFIEKNLKD